MLDQLNFDFLHEDWQPVSRVAAALWVAVYTLFMIYAAGNRSGFLFIDNVNLVVHEGGHLLFGWFGETPGLWGGTLLQWLVPALLAVWFFAQRQTTGFVFCLFMLFENVVYTAAYMADARALALPLVSVGGGDEVGHDWNIIFSSLGVLQQDTTIAAFARAVGWTGMIATTAWLGWRAFRPQPES